LTPPNYSASKNFTTIGSENSPGTKSYVYDFVGKPVPQSDGTSSISVNIDESNTTAGDLPTSITAWCYAPDFGWVSWGNVFALSPLVPIVPLTPPTGPPTTGLAGCISSDGLGLNPSSWIPGLLNMGACVLQDLFIPSQSNLTSLAQTFGITNNTPTYGSLPASQWLGGMAKALVTLPAATVSTLQTDADTGSGQCGLDGMSSMQLHDNTGHNVGPSINECYFLTAVSANTTVANGWNYIDIALTGLIYLIAALAIFFIFRSVLSGNGGS
jgi:hypothetical protein